MTQAARTAKISIRIYISYLLVPGHSVRQRALRVYEHTGSWRYCHVGPHHVRNIKNLNQGKLPLYSVNTPPPLPMDRCCGSCSSSRPVAAFQSGFETLQTCSTCSGKGAVKSSAS